MGIWTMSDIHGCAFVGYLGGSQGFQYILTLMNEDSDALQPRPPLPTDNLERRHTISRPDTDPTLPHIGLVGDTYTVLSGQDTNGRY